MSAARFPNGLEVRAAGPEIRAASGRRITGLIPYGSPADIGGQFRETIAPGAFAGSMSGDVLALRDHDNSKLLGRTASGTLSLSDTPEGLGFTLELPGTQLGDDTLELVRRGDLRGCSFGFSVPSGGDSWSGDERTLRAVNLHEISIVPVPAYADTSIALRSRQTIASLSPAARQRVLVMLAGGRS